MVADPYHYNADSDPELAFRFNADPDPVFHFNADPDPATFDWICAYLSTDPQRLYFESL